MDGKSLVDENYRILIFDDDLSLGDMLREYLTTFCNCTVTYVSSEDDFWAENSAHPFDALFLDYQLPRHNGLEILDKMVADGVEIPTIMMTGFGSETVAAKAIQSGAIDYLVKGNYDFSILPKLILKAVQLHRLQIAVRESLEKNRYQANLLNNVRDAVVVWGLDGKVSYWNQAAEELYGKPAESVLGQDVVTAYFAIFNPPYQPPAALSSGKQESERYFLNRTGKRTWISAQISYLYGLKDQERISGFMDVTRDVSYARKKQEELVRSQHFIRQILEATPNIIYTLDLKTRKIKYINSKVIDYMELDPSELENRPVLDTLVSAQDLPWIGEHYLACEHLKDGETSEYECRMIFHGGGPGSWKWVKNREAVFSRDASGAPRELIGICEDITNRKQVEEQIQSTQLQLAQATRLASIGQLASSIAHQISNPLTTIIADSQIILQQLSGDASSGLRESARAILDAGWRAQRVINELLKFSQMGERAHEKVSLEHTLQKALLLTGPQIYDAGITLDAHSFDGANDVLGNDLQLIDMWMNLILYQVSQTEAASGKSMGIHCASVDGLARVKITNDWMSLTQEQAEQIFEPQMIPTSANWGTGMELSICREIVRQHKGEIHLNLDGPLTSFEVSFARWR
jgi:PAS domain S-box-containing protein